MTWTRKPLVTEGEAFRNDHPVSGAQTNDHTEVNTMKRNSKRIFVALLAICALAAGGAAFTAAITGGPTNAVAGFAQTTINGATVNSTHWVLDQTGEWITTVNLNLTADGTNGTTDTDPLPARAVVKAGFNVGASGAIDWAPCTTTTPGSTTDFTCDMETTANPSGAPVASATVFNISASDTGTGSGS